MVFLAAGEAWARASDGARPGAAEANAQVMPRRTATRIMTHSCIVWWSIAETQKVRTEFQSRLYLPVEVALEIDLAPKLEKADRSVVGLNTHLVKLAHTVDVSNLSFLALRGRWIFSVFKTVVKFCQPRYVVCRNSPSGIGRFWHLIDSSVREYRFSAASL